MRALLLFACISLIIPFAAAQGEPDIYVQVDYMKTLGEQRDDYVWMEQMIYKPIHTERIKANEIIAWYLYEVQYPSGENTEYDFVTLTVYADFSLMDEGQISFEEIVERAHPDKTPEEVGNYASNTRSLVKSEVIKSSSRFPLVSQKPARSLLVDYMKVPPVNDEMYNRIENEIWRPLHEERHERGYILSWGLYELIFPGGVNYPYSHATATGFENWNQIKDSWPEDIWKFVHPNAEQGQLEQQAHEVRDLVSSQIWRLVDFTRLNAEGDLEQD